MLLPTFPVCYAAALHTHQGTSLHRPHPNSHGDGTARAEQMAAT
jgi:hypothetical protein